MKTVRDVCEYIGQLMKSFPVCVETGCAYTCAPGDEVHTTTNNILEYICLPNRGRLASFDIDSDHINFAKGFVSSIKLEHPGDCVFVCGDSVEKMKSAFEHLYEIRDSFPEGDPDGMPFQIDVLCLDSKEFDEDHMVNEFLAVKAFLKPDKHFVLVDDIHNPNSVKYKKMVPLLKDLGYDYVEVPTPTGMFVATKGYPLP